MKDTELEEHLPCVETLSKKSFVVPDYQRGYRWTPDEVKDLLEDIHDFATKGKYEDYYCLQPLVVQQMESGKWAVIDVQQRLTTIFLITHFINERGAQLTNLNLDYESRKLTGEFLKNLKLGVDWSVEINDQNIDFAHISKAYQAIGNWMNVNDGKSRFDYFVRVFRERVRVIWYEPEGAEPVKIFTRINRGKIPLTNAELIRALFLKGSNFTKTGATAQEEESGKLRQMELAGEWDRMEASLHNDHFWFFLT